MASRQDIDRLKQLPASSGRIIGELGSVVNQGSYLIADVISSGRLMSVRGLEFFSTPRVTVAAAATETINLKASPNKYVIQYQRSVTVDAAKWNLDFFVGGSCTAGTLSTVSPSLIGSPQPESTIETNCTLTGGSLVQSIMIPAGARNSAGAIGTGTDVVIIYPPGTEAAIQLSHDDSQPREAQVIFEFGEITQEEFDSIQNIFLG